MTLILKRAGVAALGLVLAIPVYAAVDATFVLRSGERVSGSLVDFGARGVTARVGGGTRTWSIGELAVIDFTNAPSYPAGETDRAGGGSHVLVLRDGSVIAGRLSDVGGSAPLRISFVEGGNTRDFSSNEVARIYFARPSGSAGGGAGGGGSLQPATGRIRVPATSDWVATGLTVRHNQRLQFNSTGEVRYTPDASDVAGPGGSKKGAYVQSAPIPTALAGALIGRIGNSAPFGIGNQTSIVAPASGMLYLRVNDDNLSDNSGEFGVDVTRQ
jgi:hypothetical protein